MQSAQLLVDGFRQADHIVFGGVVAGESRTCHKAGTGSHIEQDAVSVSHHVSEEKLGQKMDRGDIQIDQLQFLFQVGFQKISVHAHSGIVDDEIDIFSPRFFPDLTIEAAAFLPHGEVSGNYQDFLFREFFQNLIAQLLQLILAAGCQNQVISFYGEIFRNLPSDAGACAGDKCIHISPPWLCALNCI